MSADNTKPRVVVVDGHTLGYIEPQRPDTLCILHASVLRGATHTTENGPAYLTGREHIRLATRDDFDAFRVRHEGFLYGNEFKFDYTSSEKQQMRERVDSMREQLDALCTNEKVPYTSRTINWGGPSRGQGKRIGGMVVGAMSSALGKRTYYSVNLGEYAQDFDKTDWICVREDNRRAKYYTARRARLCHWEAMYYAITNKNSTR